MSNNYDTGPIYFEPRECLDRAIIKTEETHVTYAFELMIEALVMFYEWDVDTALEWYQKNILPTLLYIKKNYELNSPIIIHDFDELSTE
jgi:hypothetical protein